MCYRIIAVVGKGGAGDGGRVVGVFRSLTEGFLRSACAKYSTENSSGYICGMYEVCMYV